MLKVFRLVAMYLGSLQDLGSKSLPSEIHIKAANVIGDSNMAAALIHWPLGSYASLPAGLSQRFPVSSDEAMLACVLTRVFGSNKGFKRSPGSWSNEQILPFNQEHRRQN